MTLAQQARELLRQQQTEWRQCREGYASLSGVQVKSFTFPHGTIKVQSNPGRLTSTAAKVDPGSIRERKCFLCGANRPAEQREVPLHGGYLLLVNPFPIFPEHFTLPTAAHQPQQIAGNIGVLLSLAYQLAGSYSVFYNGPKCGASAPDHLHFQAGTAGYMPIEGEIPRLRDTCAIASCSVNGVDARLIDDGLRRFVVFTASAAAPLEAALTRFIAAYSGGSEEEPLMNITASCSPVSGVWTVILFLRAKHRPACFFAEGNAQLLLSPATVDIGGFCVTPRLQDFQKITAADITAIFSEVFPSAASAAAVFGQFSEMC